MNFLQDAISQHLPAKHKRTPSGWISVNCPMCQMRGEPTPDTKMRGGFALDATGTVGYHCFRCGYATKWEEGQAIPNRLVRLMRTLSFSPEEVRRLQFEAMRQRRIHVPVDHDDKQPVDFEPPTFETKELPEGAKPFSHWASMDNPPHQFVKVAEYLLSRGRYVFEGWNYYWTPNKYKKMDWRFIMPFYHRGEIVGWTARYAGKPPKNVDRYYSDQPPNYLLNSDALFKPNRQYALLVEGALDTVALDCVGTLGNTLNEKQIKWINSSKKQKIVVPDLAYDSTSLAQYAMENDWMASFPDWEEDCKDPAEAVRRYGRVYTLKSIIDSATDNKVKIGMYVKKYTKKPKRRW